MKYNELKEKLLELKEALKNKSNLMQSDEEKIREVLNECSCEMNKAESLKKRYEGVMKNFKELIIKVNTLKQQEDYIFNSNMGLGEKINKFSSAIEKTNEKAQNLKVVKDELEKLEEEISNFEVNKKIENLMGLWLEIKKIADIEEEISPIEIQIVECNNEEIQPVEAKEDISSFFEVLKEIDKEISETDTKSKKKFKIF